MPVRVTASSTRYAAFFLLALTINIVDSTLVRSISDPGKRLFVAGGAVFDLTLTVSATYYWLLVRPGIRGRASLMAIALIGILRATFLFPNARTVTAAVGALCELGLAAFVIVQVRQRVRHRRSNPDPADAIRQARSARHWSLS